MPLYRIRKTDRRSILISLLSALAFGIAAVRFGLAALIRIHKADTVLPGKAQAWLGLIAGLLPLLAFGIAIPNFVKARTTSCHNACCQNLRQLDGAKEQWALDHQITNRNITPKWSDLVGPDKYLKVKPECKAKGTYQLNDLNSKPTCSIGSPDHAF